MNKVTVSVPGKLMIMGEYAVLDGYPCLSTAVDRRLSLTLEESDEKILEISTDIGLVNFRREIIHLDRTDIPKEVKFIVRAVRNFREKFPLKSGLKISTVSQFTPNVGFGSSAAVSVAAIFALDQLFKTRLTMKGIFHLSFQSHYEVQKAGSGFDIATVLYGGTIFFQNKGEIIEKLDNGFPGLKIIYSGKKTDTVRAIEKMAKLEVSRQASIIYEQIGQLVRRARYAVSAGDLNLLGKLMNENQLLLEKLGVIDKHSADLIKILQKAQAQAVKISGAGGGDCLIALGLRENLLKHKLKLIPLKINARGAYTL